MTISDESVVAAVGWIGTSMTAAITYLYFQVVSLNRKVGKLEEELENYRDCPIHNCFFRTRSIPPSGPSATGNYPENPTPLAS